MDGSSFGNPQNFAPHAPYPEPLPDCSYDICTPECPQLCHDYAFPPPSPFTGNTNPYRNDPTLANFSPAYIVIIALAIGALLRTLFCAIRCCGGPARGITQEGDLEIGLGNGAASNQTNKGLSEALINSIATFKYKKEERLVDETECPVCLSEFQEDEALRLLPECSHAFHVPCIDAWLSSHSNCPVCRAGITFVDDVPVRLPPPPLSAASEAPDYHDRSEAEQSHRRGIELEEAEAGGRVQVEMLQGGFIPKNSGVRTVVEFGNSRGAVSVIRINKENFAT